MKSKTWLVVGISLLLVVGFIIWNDATHRRVEEFVARGPAIPGSELPSSASEEFFAFAQVRNGLTRRVMQDDVKITVTWNTPAFFKALAAAEGEKDIRRHETLYHDYAERFNVHSELVFTVIMDSETVDLEMVPFIESSLLRNDKGYEVRPVRWSEGMAPSPRRREGLLYFPQRAIAGRHMIGHLTGGHMPGEKPPAVLELILKGSSEGEESVFRWELSPPEEESQ